MLALALVAEWFISDVKCLIITLIFFARKSLICSGVTSSPDGGSADRSFLSSSVNGITAGGELDLDLEVDGWLPSPPAARLLSILAVVIVCTRTRELKCCELFFFCARVLLDLVSTLKLSLSVELAVSFLLTARVLGLLLSEIRLSSSSPSVLELDPNSKVACCVCSNLAASLLSEEHFAHTQVSLPV